MRPARWTHHTSLFQIANPAFWVFGGMLLATGVVAVAEQGWLLAIAPAGLVLSWVLLAGYLLPMVVVVYRLDLYEREPLTMLGGALLWGAVAATTLAGLGNQGWSTVVLQAGGPQFAADWSAALTAPFVEEIVKGAGIVLLYQIAPFEWDDVLDGFVYGAMVGLGFAVVEDVFYFVVVFGGSVPGVLAGFLLRVVASGLYGHVLYSALVGMGVAFLKTSSRPAPVRWGVAGGLCSLAVGAHFLWNAPLFDYLPDDPRTLRDLVMIPLGLAVKGVPLLVLVLAAVRLEHERQHRVFARLIEPEVGGDAISLEQAQSLAGVRSRRAAVRSARRSGGRPAARVCRKLQRSQITLGLLRSKLRDPDHPDVAAERERCTALRRRLGSLTD